MRGQGRSGGGAPIPFRQLAPAGRRRLVAAAVGLACTVIGGACQVRTEVAVTARPDGSGSVAVSVTLDAAADAAVGGLSQQIRTSDLAAAGWIVTGPHPAAGGGEVVTATHPFASLAGASPLVASLAASGSARPFQLTLSRHHSLWHTETSLQGDVDLTCGVDCFGDAGLAALTGSKVGFDPAAVARQAGVDPAAVLRFRVQVTLPGSLRRSDAASRPAPATLAWQPQLGQRLVLTATTTSWNHAPVVTAAAISAVVPIVVLLGSAWWWRRRRRRPGVVEAPAMVRDAVTGPP